MNTQLQELCELDQLIISKLEFSEINAEEITQRINREQLLQNDASIHRLTPDVKKSKVLNGLKPLPEPENWSNWCSLRRLE